MKKILLILAFVVILPALLQAFSRDFSYSYKGHTITYSVLDENTKTCTVKAGNDTVSGNSVIGDLVLPSNPKDSNMVFTLTEIGDYAFYANDSLTSVTIPNSVQRIGIGSFAYCYMLNKAEFESIEHLCKIQFATISSNPLLVAKHLYINGLEVNDLDIPNTVSKIGDHAFIGGKYLTSVSIPNSVTEIGRYTFGFCGMKSVVIPNSVKKIDNLAFSYCYDLTSVSIPNSIVSIGDSTFYGSYLNSVYYETENPIVCNNNVFLKNPHSPFPGPYRVATLYLPAKGVEKAKEIEPWKLFSKIEEYDFSGLYNLIPDKVGEVDYTAPYEIYNLNGIKVEDCKENLTPGLYVVRQGHIVKKIVIR